MTLDTHTAIIGTTGAGKTVTAKVQVEQLLRENRHLAIIDPLGVWYGLRTAADGESAGFPIPIFGGEHGDVPILPEQGGAVGAYIAGGMSAIIDLSGMDQRDGRTFMLAFMRALRKKPKTNFHLIVDEADEFAPQTAPDDIGFQLVEQMAWVAKRGRTAGFVLTVITQRPADIAKAVLSQMQTIIAHQLIAPLDQKALDDYLKANGDAATRKAVMASLPGLDRGERWVYAPRAGVLERGVSPLPTTFDSSRTPEPGETLTPPRMLASIDLGEIRAALAPAQSEEPAASASGKSEADGAEVTRLRERIAVLEGDMRAIEGMADAAYERGKVAGISIGITRARAAIDALRIPDIASSASAAAIPHQDGGHHVDRSAGARPIDQEPPVPAKGKGHRGSDRDSTSTSVAAGGSPSPAALAIADLLDRINPARVTWAQAAAMTGRKATGGNFNAARKWLRGSGRLVEDGDLIRSSADAPAGMTREEAITLWKGALTSPAPKMIDAFLLHGNLTKEQLGGAIGAQPRGGNFNNGLAQLRRNGLIYEYGSGTLRLAEPLPGEAK